MCPHGKSNETMNLHGCSIIASTHAERIAERPKFRGMFGQRVVLDQEAINLIEQCAEGVEY